MKYISGVPYRVINTIHKKIVVWRPKDEKKEKKS
jgi:hypothetical protein